MRFFILSTFIILISVSCSVIPAPTANKPINSPDPVTNLLPDLTGIFVSPIGNDTNAGTNRSIPVYSLSTALSNAIVLGLTNIYIALGNYLPGAGLLSSVNGIVITNSGLNLSGGWDNQFALSSGYSVLNGTGTLTHVLFAANVSNLLIQGLMIQNGNANGGGIPDTIGGGMFLTNISGCLITNDLIINNYAVHSGGGIWMCGKSNTLTGMIVSNNSCDYYWGYGGGITMETGSFYNSIDGIVTGNIAYYGGGLFMNTNSGRNTVSGIFQFNSANYGGGIGLFSSHSNTINATISTNTGSTGGGINISSDYNTISGTVCSNHSGWDGGGIEILGNFNKITALVIDNLSTAWGGGIIVYSGISNSITDFILRNNGSVGGGICDRATGTRINAMIINNIAIYTGGGLYIWNDPTINTNGSIFNNNYTNDFDHN